MAKITLPDTAVVDLTVLQTIVNALNRHEDVISKLAASYSSVPKTADATQDDPTKSPFDTTFNLTTHEIQFGKVSVPSTKVITTNVEADASGKQLEIAFDRAFATPPMVVAVVRTNFDYYVEVNSTTTTLFKASVRGTAEHSGAWVNWIAIGTKVV